MSQPRLDLDVGLVLGLLSTICPYGRRPGEKCSRCLDVRNAAGETSPSPLYRGQSALDTIPEMTYNSGNDDEHGCLMYDSRHNDGDTEGFEEGRKTGSLWDGSHKWDMERRTSAVGRCPNRVLIHASGPHFEFPRTIRLYISPSAITYLVLGRQ
jgi:hypothetical protein